MKKETKIRKIGNSYGIILPKETLNAMKAQEGTTLYLTDSTENSVRVSTAKPGFGDMMNIAEQGMQDYNNALRELAK